MASYSLAIKPSAVKELESIPQKKLRQQIVKRIQNLAENPCPSGSIKLTGYNLYRIRQGMYRIVYSVEKEKLVIVVIKIAHRKDVYRAPLGAIVRIDTL